MRRNQTLSNETLMEHAIEKASRLIALLQEENQQLKAKINKTEQELIQSDRALQILKKEHKDQTEIIEKMKQRASQAEESLTRVTNAAKQAENRLKDKIQNNKELHEKLSVMTVRVKELAAQQKEERTKYLSLENQNQYLIRQLQKRQQKENKFSNVMQQTKHEFTKELTELDRVKQAFSRRCDELKAQSMNLRKIISQQSLKCNDFADANRVMMGKLLDFQEKAKEQEYLTQQITRLVEIHIGAKPAKTVDEQITQIINFVNYRLAHIATICREIFEKVGKISWKETNTASITDISVAAQRLASYLSELV